MIPKIIHYCWFGDGDMPELAIKCINSWKHILPNYDLVLWNEQNFDININDYVRDAYKNGKYAFVTDFVRLYALYNYGGIYMDTDVEVLKSFDEFLVHEAFTGCESDSMCVTGTIGAKKGNIWIKRLLDKYKNRQFILPNGSLDITTNTKIITNLTIKEYGWISENKHQILKDGLNIYPFEVFCAKNFSDGNITITEKTHSIHHFSGSWISEGDKRKSFKRQKWKRKISKIVGNEAMDILLKLRNSIIK